MWTGLAINVTTGLLLLTAYPTKALTNPDFYVKLTFIGLAVLHHVQNEHPSIWRRQLERSGHDRQREDDGEVVACFLDWSGRRGPTALGNSQILFLWPSSGRMILEIDHHTVRGWTGFTGTANGRNLKPYRSLL